MCTEGKCDWKVGTLLTSCKKSFTYHVEFQMRRKIWSVVCSFTVYFYLIFGKVLKVDDIKTFWQVSPSFEILLQKRHGLRISNWASPSWKVELGIWILKEHQPWRWHSFTIEWIYCLKLHFVQLPNIIANCIYFLCLYFGGPQLRIDYGNVSATSLNKLSTCECPLQAFPFCWQDSIIDSVVGVTLWCDMI